MKFLLILTSGILFLAATMSSARPLRIAAIPEEPLRYHSKDRVLVGIDVDILAEIFRPAGIKYKIILLHSSESLREFYQKNLCDMVLTLSKNPERERFLEYAEMPHLRVSWNFYARKELAKTMKFTGYEILEGKRLGVTKNFAYTSEFWQHVGSGKFKVVYEDRNREQINNLVNNQVDLVMLNSMTANALIKREKLTNVIAKVEGTVRTGQYFNTFVKNSGYPGIDRVKKVYNEALKKLVDADRYGKILAKY